MSAFAVIVAGRMVQTEFTMVREGEFVIELANADSINHIAVFLTGLHPLPPDYGGSIYLSWPDSAGEGGPQWHYLSFVSNAKPSAFFKIGQLMRKAAQQPSDQQQMQLQPFLPNNFGQIGTPSQGAILGIILEPLSQIQQRSEPERALDKAAPVQQFAEKMLNNFVNFVQSFAVSLPKPGTLTGQMEEFVPTKAVTDWFSNFQRKLQMDPNFWKILP